MCVFVNLNLDSVVEFFENGTNPPFEKTDKARFEIGVIKIGKSVWME